jgi:hypothetical protein
MKRVSRSLRRRAVPRGHQAFLAMMPQIIAHARVSFRHLDPEARQEAVQEVIANACQAYVRLAQLKKVDLAYPTVLARYAVAQVKDHRKVGSKLNVLDISSTYCQQRKGVVVERLDHFDEEENAWLEICIEDRHAGPAEIAATRMDFAAWLKSLPQRLRRIAKFLATGETTTVAAKRFGVCPGRISQIRMELKRAWQTFQGEEPGAAALAA